MPSGTTRFTNPIALGLVGVELAAGEDEVERAAEPDDPRQPVGAAVDERHAPAALEAPEAGRRRRRRGGRTTPPARRRRPRTSPRSRRSPASTAAGGSARAGRVGRSAGRSCRLAPAQNAVSSPVRTATRASSSASKARNSSCSRAAVAQLIALRTCGLVDAHDADGVAWRVHRRATLRFAPMRVGGAGPPGAGGWSRRAGTDTRPDVATGCGRRRSTPSAASAPSRARAVLDLFAGSRRARHRGAVAGRRPRHVRRARPRGPRRDPRQPRGHRARRPGRRSCRATPSAYLATGRADRSTSRCSTRRTPSTAGPTLLARAPGRRRRGRVRPGRSTPATGWEVVRAKRTAVRLWRSSAAARRQLTRRAARDRRALPGLVRPLPQRAPRARRDRRLPLRRGRRRRHAQPAEGRAALHARRAQGDDRGVAGPPRQHPGRVSFAEARRRRRQGRRRRLHRQGPAGDVRLRERDGPGPDEPRRLRACTPCSSRRRRPARSSRRSTSATSPASAATVSSMVPEPVAKRLEGEVSRRHESTTTKPHAADREARPSAAATATSHPRPRRCCGGSSR